LHAYDCLRFQERIRKAQKAAAGSNLQTALNGAVASADAAVAESQPFCVLRIDVGLDTNAVREAVTLVMDKHKVCFNLLSSLTFLNSMLCCSNLSVSQHLLHHIL
jgi:hypothetical protein